MKRLLLALALLCGLAFGQTNIINSDIGPYHVLGRNLIPVQIGQGGLQNYFIFTPLNPNQGVCLYMYNNTSTPATGVAYTVFSTGDPNATGIAGNTTRWIQTQTQAISSLAGNGLFSYYIQPPGAARIAILSGGGGSTTVDLIAVETANGTQCGSNIASTTYCPYSITQAVASGATTLIKTGTSFIAVHVCSYHLSIAGATVTAAHNSFKAGIGSTCGGSTATLWQIDTGAVEDQLMLSAAPGGQLFETNLAFSNAAQIGAPQLNLCYTDGGTTAGTKVNITYNAF